MSAATRFTATFDSECEQDGCWSEIEAGEEAGYIGDTVACEGCCDEYDARFEL